MSNARWWLLVVMVALLMITAVGDMVMATVKKGKPELRKKGKYNNDAAVFVLPYYRILLCTITCGWGHFEYFLIVLFPYPSITPSDARRDHPPAQALEEEGWCLYLLRG